MDVEEIRTEEQPNTSVEETAASPVEAPAGAPAEESDAPSGRGKKGGKQPEEKRYGKITRIEALKKQLQEEGIAGAEADDVVSMYIPRRRLRRFAAGLLRWHKLRLALLLAVLLLAIIFIAAFLQEKAGNFTINLDRLELYRKGIAIAADGNFTEPTARLTAEVVKDATNITLEDLPYDLDEIDGDHSGANYMAYTYYVRNAGKEDVAYYATLRIMSASKGVENATRVAIWHNGERTIYAAPAANGEPEPDTVSFESPNLVFSYTEEAFLVGNVDKYTIVIWLEGEDPECVDEIVGGSIEFVMDIKAVTDDDTSLFQKWVQDIRDTLTDDKPIGAGGVDSPDYYSDREVTWATRRNQ